jgi:hypothetical protein
MDAEAAVRAWIDAWKQAWPAKDAAAIAAMYADDARYLSHPFREPHRGSAGAGEYARSAFDDEDAVEIWFGEPVVSADRAAVEYWAILVSGEREQTLAGTTVLRFAPDGRVADHRDYWSMEDGRREPPDGWGR